MVNTWWEIEWERLAPGGRWSGSGQRPCGGRGEQPPSRGAPVPRPPSPGPFGSQPPPRRRSRPAAHPTALNQSLTSTLTPCRRPAAHPTAGTSAHIEPKATPKARTRSGLGHGEGLVKGTRGPGQRAHARMLKQRPGQGHTAACEGASERRRRVKATQGKRRRCVARNARQTQAVHRRGNDQGQDHAAP